MKKEISKQKNAIEDNMRPEYDFSKMAGGVRGKYFRDYRKGHKVVIHKTDGTTEVQYFKLEDGAVMLDSDVRKYFPDSEAVNDALRCLIPIMRGKQKAKQKNLV